MITELASTTFDSLYMKTKRKKICHLIRKPDLFDGKAYTIDEFYDFSKPFFDRPWDFYKDYTSEHVIDLVAGLHPLESGKPKNFHAYTFTSPVKTDWSENNCVPFKWFTAGKRLSDTLLLFVPGWGRPSQSIEEKMSDQFRQLGIDVGLVTAPLSSGKNACGLVLWGILY